MSYNLLIILDILNIKILVPTIIGIIISILSIMLFFYENRKRQRDKRRYKIVSSEYDKINSLYKHLDSAFNRLDKKHNEIEKENEKLNAQKKILSQIINCANKALDDGEIFQKSMKSLATELRNIFKSEYCAIGKVVENAVEDFVVSFDEYENESLLQKQIRFSQIVRRVDINNENYKVCKALNTKRKDIFFYSESQIITIQNSHYNIYEKYILKTKKISNTTVIPLRDKNLVNYGYVQFINTKETILIDDINPFKDALLQLIQLIIDNESKQKELNQNKKFVEDSKFIKSIIETKDDVNGLLDEIMKYLSKEFNAAVISFRIPILNGYQSTPLFYLRRCYINNKVTNRENLQNDYDKYRKIKNQNELGSYNRLKCINKGAIIADIAKDTDYYSTYKLNLKEQTLIMPILRDIDAHKCLNETRENREHFCHLCESQNCTERFKKLYGIFKLRIFNENTGNTEIDNSIIKSDEEKLLKETKERLAFLSKQITLLLNSIVDKYENESLTIFQEQLKDSSFVKIKEFDQQCVDIIQKSIHTKGCSIYRFSEREQQLYLSATTVKQIKYNDKIEPVEKIIEKCVFSISDQNSVLVRVYNNTEKKSKYLFDLNKGVHIGNFIENLDDDSSINNESVFIVPMLKKDKEQTCIGVVLLIGKQANSHNISTAYWEHDREHIEFIVDILTRIAEADTERLTFLSQLSHELLKPITELVYDNDDVITTAERNKESYSKDMLIAKLKENLYKNFLFKYVVSDVEDIYSSTKDNIVYNIVRQEKPQSILLDAIRLLEKEAHFSKSLNIVTHISDMPALYLDENRIKQVFINLLKNAIRYSDTNSTIDIYYKYEDCCHEIKFVNYGIGIKEEEKEAIFNLFHRGKEAKKREQRGTGMGLYIVKGIMKAHNGDCVIRRLHNPTEISVIFPDKSEINNKL